MYVDRSCHAYESKTIYDANQKKVGEEQLTIGYNGSYSVNIKRESRVGIGYLSDRVTKYTSIIVFVNVKEHQFAFVQAIMGWMPYAILADFIEDNSELCRITETNQGDKDYLLSELRTWGN